MTKKSIYVMKFTIIVAHDKKRGIGKNNDIPWRNQDKFKNFIKEDINHFRKTTTNVLNSNKKNAVIMGRKTWESLPKKFRPLSDRLNIILSKKYEKIDDQLTFKTLDDALNYVNGLNYIENVFVIGGQEIYEEAIKHQDCEKLLITEINNEFDCDRYFPEYNEYSEIWESIRYDDGLYQFKILKKMINN